MGFQWSRTDRTVGEGFLRIAHEQIAKAIESAGDGSATAERRVHEARRRCKKLRALFRLARPDFPAYGTEDAFVRDAARGLAGARDQRVVLATFAGLMQWAGRPRAEPEAATRPDEPGEEAALAAFVDRMRQLEARLAGWPVGRIDLDTLANGLRHTYRRARWTRRLAERQHSDEAFHEWRKYAKYHWNQLGLLEECAEDVLPSAQKSAGELADVLGLHHDLAVLEQVLATDPETLGPDIDAAFITAAIARRRAELEARIEVLGKQVFAETPKALKARFKAYLHGWPERVAAA